MIAPAASRALVVAAALVLLWRVVHVNASIYEDTNRPVFRMPAEAAVRPAALVAELSANPASMPALLQWVLDRDAAGDSAGATRALQAARDIGPIDRQVLLASARLNARHGRLAEAVPDIDRLLTHYDLSRDALFAALAGWLSDAQARAALERVAARPSPWMGRFLVYACSRVDPRLAAALLAPRAAAGQAGKEETACVIDGLRRAGHWAEAYQAWLNTLPRERLAEVGFVYNGGFEHAPGPAGFDWITDARSPSHAADFAITSDAQGNRALRVMWTGKRVATPAVQQYLALDPGRYELSGLARMDGLQSVRGVHWALRCAAEPRRTLATSPRFMGAGPWERFSVPVDVPPGCVGQLLQLEPAGLNEGTTFVSGKAWFDELKLTRLH